MNEKFNFGKLEPLTTAALNCCVHGNGNSYYLWNNAKSYYEKLAHALDDIINNNQKDYLFFSFITLCSATLEYSLNLIYAFHCFRQFEHDLYNSYLEPYKNMRFKNKLFMLPYILSEGKFVTNENCRFVKILYDLISKRNGLLHNSEKPHQFNFPDTHASIIDGRLIVPIEHSEIEFSLSIEDNIIDAINKEDCVKIGNAMFAFYQQIMIPFINDGELKICEFVIPR